MAIYQNQIIHQDRVCCFVCGTTQSLLKISRDSDDKKILKCVECLRETSFTEKNTCVKSNAALKKSAKTRVKKLNYRSKIIDRVFVGRECHCFYCKKPLDNKTATIDHFRPKFYGGKNFQNRVISCINCNSKKSNLSIDEFRDILLVHLKINKTGYDHEYLREAINTCSLILNGFLEPPLF